MLLRFTTVPSLVVVSEALHPVSLHYHRIVSFFIFVNLSPVQFISTNQNIQATFMTINNVTFSAMTNLFSNLNRNRCAYDLLPKTHDGQTLLWLEFA